ncbi:isoleucine--tRNA ligase [Culicoidibacter larvae]|uniref:Isoleucine--tRNA ligase n=1 Tax=Culicoidibacter larvae TaxID=2579976 RepID=A0A5R8QF63_9FIRM|nr:isoleucine--tRNA ligase [Culicoidibacter larvae]TLG76612.1 isoleucine--tRNA ligase [Culicoidibacter larvae]
MDYKDTLHMMKTDFPMRGNLPQNEPGLQQRWNDLDLYNAVVAKNADKPTFILHDGPPYANGNLHTGHAMNKILKDFITRYRAMSGFNAVYIPGWDTHGLPIEQAVTNSGVNRKEKTVAEFRKICEEYAEKQVANQMEQFKRLGVWGDYEHAYLTLQKEYEAEQIKVFAKMVQNGLIYKGLKPVYWSPSSESALAEAEIEYYDKLSPSIYVAFAVRDGKGVLSGDEKFIIWTTTPWTIPVNMGIAVHPDFDYVVAECDGVKYVFEASFVDQLTTELGWNEVKILQTINGKELDRLEATHPLFDRVSLVTNSTHVTREAGTGIVHMAPAHGEDDFIVGQKYGLEIVSATDDKGIMTEATGPFAGQYYEKSNTAITDALEAAGALLKLEMIEHSYPHDWRTKKPIIFRATDQWFASIESIRSDLLDAIDNTDWIIPWGRVRLYNMIEGRGDWCISRQRVWGVPIPIFYAENKQPILDAELMNHIAELFRQHGSNVWFEREAKDLLPEGYTHPDSPNGVFTKETDIMDVWFDSGTSYNVIERAGLSYPADIYLEGSDQYRGWFNSSLITGVATHGQAPYKAVASHGFVLDGKGRKMSKSLGNTIEPAKLIKQYGADILRLWVASVDYQADVRISDEIIKQVAESYRKIRNTLRFLVGNVHDFNSVTDMVAIDDLAEVDVYMLTVYNRLLQDVRKGYETYDFASVYKRVLHFMSNELSSFYLDFTKDILYIEAKNDSRRRAVQTVLYTILVSITKLLAPILAHTTDELWQYIDGVEEESVFLATNDEYQSFANQEQIVTKWETFLNFREDVLKALEEARNQKVIGKSLEAQLDVYLHEDVRELIISEVNDFRQLLMVSGVTVHEQKQTDMEDFATAAIAVSEFDGVTCERCWNRYEASSMHNDEICERCANAMVADQAEA